MIHIMYGRTRKEMVAGVEVLEAVILLCNLEVPGSEWPSAILRSFVTFVRPYTHIIGQDHKSGHDRFLPQLFVVHSWSHNSALASNTNSIVKQITKYVNNSHHPAWSRVPTTGVFDKCTNSCALYKERSEKKLSYSFWRLVIVIAFPRLVHLATRHAEWYWLSMHKSLVCLSSINESW